MEQQSNTKYSFMPLHTDTIDSNETKKSEAYLFLKSLIEFSKISEEDINKLAASSRFETIESGKYITIEGDERNTFGFILQSGCIAMSKNSSNGKDLIVELLQAGDSFGLLLNLAKDRLPIQLSARSIQKSRILWVPLTDFSIVLRSNPIIFKEIVAHLLLCLFSSYNISRGLAHDHVEVRIASILLSLAYKFDNIPRESKIPIIHFTRQQLADLTGTTPETAIRVTRAMQKDGLIDISRPGIIKILKMGKLKDISECS
jgi:CRP-like cAMP-binding protein